jgi:NMD protein affecting ribosome stability and mRNA decay
MKRRDPLQRQRRHIDRAMQDPIQDPYAAKGKPAGPAICPDCGAVFRRGRWQWGEASESARPHLCAACRRVRERSPAGTVRIQGAFVDAHRGEILRTVRNEEAREKRTHPMQRIMTLREAREAIEVTTTDIHVARRIGEALRSAFRGTLVLRYSPHEYRVRVSWSRA